MLKKIVFAAGIMTLSASAASAAEDLSKYTVQDAIVRSECGDCHMVFPPNRLNQNGWRKIMQNLSDHFGEDASMDPAKAKHIEDYLTANAWDAKDTYPTKLRKQAWKKKGIVDPVRITETPNWTRHHSSAKYKAMAKDIGYERGSNCIKCHKGAESGVYEEFPGYKGFN